MAITCSKCGLKQGLMAALTADLGTGKNLCSKCADEDQKEALQKAADEARRVQDVKRAAQQVIVTTTPKVDGFYVARYIGIESVEFVIGTGVFSEMSSSIADFLGARSTAFENKLQIAKKHALAALKYVAAEQGANAVIGVDLDYTEFSGNRVALIINGTLVQIAPNPTRKPIT